MKIYLPAMARPSGTAVMSYAELPISVLPQGASVRRKLWRRISL